MATTRRVTVAANFTGQDYETFGSNEYPAPFNTTQAVVLADAVPQNVMYFEQRWGGECRAVFTVLAQRLDDDGVRISGELQLFEGTSEDTNDLDGRRPFEFYCARKSTIQQEVYVRNDDENDDDWAKVQMTVSNFIEEENAPAPSDAKVKVQLKTFATAQVKSRQLRQVSLSLHYISA
jgi:hypothetical protein